MNVFSFFSKPKDKPRGPQVVDYPKEQYEVYWETFIAGDAKVGFKYKVRLIEHRSGYIMDSLHGEMQKEKDALEACHKWIVQHMKSYKRVS